MNAFGDRLVHVTLTVDHAAPAGRAAPALVTLTPARGWHLYGPEHGDAGVPPAVTWHLPPGVAAGTLAFPPARRVVAHGLTTYEYAGPVTLRVPLRVATDRVPQARIPIRADVSWVACAHACVPGRAVVGTTLTIVPAPAPLQPIVSAAFLAWATLALVLARVRRNGVHGGG